MSFKEFFCNSGTPQVKSYLKSGLTSSQDRPQVKSNKKNSSIKGSKDCSEFQKDFFFRRSLEAIS